MANNGTAPDPRRGDGRNTPTIRELLASEGTKKRMMELIPRHLSPERMIRIASNAIYRRPKLAQCHPMTLLGSIMACGMLGLEPDTPLGHAWLLPFDNNKRNTVDVTLIIGYKGYLDLARRSGLLVSATAEVVRENDAFDYEYGSESRCRHKPAEEWNENSPITHAYCYMKLTGGSGFRVLTIGEIYKARARSKSANTGPWVTDFAPMAAKTAVRRLAAFMPLSLEHANAAAVDDSRVDFRAIHDASNMELMTSGPGSFVDSEPDDDDADRDDGPAAATDGPTDSANARAAAARRASGPEATGDTRPRQRRANAQSTQQAQAPQQDAAPAAREPAEVPEPQQSAASGTAVADDGDDDGMSGPPSGLLDGEDD